MDGRGPLESDVSGEDVPGVGPGARRAAYSIVGDSPPMQRVRGRIARVAPTGAAVLITGGLGVGKERVARAIHDGSGRAALPFVALTGEALAEAVAEPDPGRGEPAGQAAAVEPGTLFLADIGELGATGQAALLRFLKERRFRRAGDGTGGGEVPFPAARIVMATTRHLARMVEGGRFRRDLFYLVNVFTIHLPPLSARRQDVAPLARHFVERFAAETGRDLRGLSPAAERALEAHAWPGNVAELENVIERAAVLEVSNRVQAESLELDAAPGPHPRSPLPPRGDGAVEASSRVQAESLELDAAPGPHPRSPSPPRGDGAVVAPSPGAPAEPLPESGFVLERHVRDLERDYLARALHQAGGVKVRAAGLLGMSFRSFRYYAKKFDLG